MRTLPLIIMVGIVIILFLAIFQNRTRIASFFRRSSTKVTQVAKASPVPSPYVPPSPAASPKPTPTPMPSATPKPGYQSSKPGTKLPSTGSNELAMLFASVAILGVGTALAKATK